MAILCARMLAFAAERIMEAEVEARTGRGQGCSFAAARGAAQRIPRPVTGTPEPGGSRWRSRSSGKGSYFPSFLEPRRTRREGARGGDPGSLRPTGSQTRSVDDLVKAMGAGGMSKSQVSRLCGEDR